LIPKLSYDLYFTPNQYGLPHGSLKSWLVLKVKSWQNT
jgi:hypothetical protein